MTVNEIAYLFVGLGIGYVLGTLFYKPPIKTKPKNKYIKSRFPWAK